MAETFDEDSKAIALGFDKENDPAPKVLATGAGAMAEQIIKIAKEHNIEIREDAALTDILSALELDDYIPLEAYAAVAEILSYLYKKNGEKQQGQTNS